MGNLCVSIQPDIGMSGCIVIYAGLSTASHTCVGYYNRETLEPDYDVMDKYERQEKREALEQDRARGTLWEMVVFSRMSPRGAR